MAGLVPNVWAGILIPMVFAAMALILRLKVRRMTKMGFGLDDVLCVFAWAFAVGYSIDLMIWLSHFRLGQRLASFDDAQIEYYMERSRLMLWVSEYFYSWSIGLSKLAVLWFYRRIFRVSSIKIPIIIVMVSCVIWVTLRTFLTLFRCNPIYAAWDKTIPDARCIINVTKFYVGTDIAHTSLDVIILILPIFEIVKMSLPWGQKLAVVGLFASGSIVCIASVFQIIEANRYHPGSRELPYEMALAMTWGSVEVHLAVFTSCVALLRPIFRKLVPGLSSGISEATSRCSEAVIRSPARNPRNDLRSPEFDEETQDSDMGSMHEVAPQTSNIEHSSIAKKDLNFPTRGSVEHREYGMSEGLPHR